MKNAYPRWIIAILIIFLWIGTDAGAQWPRIVPSGDGTLISYEVRGKGSPALVFVHGWSCDARYWREQLPYFSKRHRVVLVDLAGHGHSAMTRANYTMRSFGEDVRAVTEAAGCKRAILIGHSMGGTVIAEAARLMPERVMGLIGVDTLEDIEYPMTRQALDQMTAPLKLDFQAGCRAFVGSMLSQDNSPGLRNWILSDMAAAPPAVALSAMESLMSQYITKEAAKIFDGISAPVICVNGGLWPINYEANRRHMAFFDAIIVKGADHFLMMNRPGEFNPALEKAVSIIQKREGK